MQSSLFKSIRGRSIFITVVMLISAINLHAQEESRFNWYFGSRVHYGFMHPFRKSVKYNVTDHIYSLELFAGRQYTGINFWDRLYRYPEAGIGYYYGSLGNNKVFGKAHALYPYFSAPLYSGKKYRANYLIGAGVAYITKTFDLDENNLNILIGSHLNAFIRFAIQNEYQLSERLTLSNELVMIHYSNGRIKSPNKGLNQVTTSIGLKYFPEYGNTVRSADIPGFQRKNEFSLVSGYATKMIDHFNTGRYNVFALACDYSRHISYKRELTAGLDISYDGSLIKLISDDTGSKAGTTQAVRIGIHAGQEVKFYDVGITLQAGAYIYNKWKKENHFIYQRYGIRYYLSDSIFAAAVLKAHLGVADYLTWGIGLNF